MKEPEEWTKDWCIGLNCYSYCKKGLKLIANYTVLGVKFSVSCPMWMTCAAQICAPMHSIVKKGLLYNMFVQLLDVSWMYSLYFALCVLQGVQHFYHFVMVYLVIHLVQPKWVTMLLTRLKMGNYALDHLIQPNFFSEFVFFLVTVFVIKLEWVTNNLISCRLLWLELQTELLWRWLLNCRKGALLSSP